jgi:Ca2+-transporting ATPase
MTVVQGWTQDNSFSITGEGYSPTGVFQHHNQPFDPTREPATNLLLLGGLLCNDAQLEVSGEENGKRSWRIIGDPTEGALVVAAAKAGLNKGQVDVRLPRMMEIPFDSERKRMLTIHARRDGVEMVGDQAYPENPGSAVVFVKGAPDILLDYCSQTINNGQILTLTIEDRQKILLTNHEMACQALRVLGVAYRPLAALPETETVDEVEQELVFVGLLGMIDPARPEVKTAVQIAQGAGLKSVMVTGDYRDTAVAIAGEIGLLTPGGKVLTGAELDQLSETELAGMVEQVDAYARVSPQHKTKIVEAFKACGHVVAMTGDGVNDAPALKRANIGVAMGISGTDVTKETADMVLTDDNYASIVSAIEEGRIIYSNIRKFVYYLISCNIGEILIIFLAMLAGLPAPLRAIQLLWLNLVTDGAPALALGLEQGDPDIMQHKPRPTHEPVINREMLVGIGVQAVVMTGAVLLAFLYGLSRYPGDLQGAQTVAFATLVVSELLRAFTARSEYHSLFSIGWKSNRWMLWAVGSSLVLLLLSMYVPFLQPFFGTVPLQVTDWIVMAPLFLVASLAAEITKAFLRRRTLRPQTLPA